MTPLALRADLDKLACNEAGCTCTALDDGIVLESSCHPDYAMWATYKHGELKLECAQCGQPVITVAVAG